MKKLLVIMLLVGSCAMPEYIEVNEVERHNLHSRRVSYGVGDIITADGVDLDTESGTLNVRFDDGEWQTGLVQVTTMEDRWGIYGAFAGFLEVDGEYSKPVTGSFYVAALGG